MAPTFVDVLGERAAHVAGPAVEYVDGSVVASLGYPELDARARSIGASLVAHGLTGQRVLVLLPRDLEYVAALLGCWYAGVVAVPRPERDLPAVLADADPAAAIVPPDTSLPGLATLSVTSLSAPPADWRRPDIDSDTLALLHYAGGHGVMVSHGNLVAAARQTGRLFGTGHDARVVSRLAGHRDLVTGVLHPILAGSSSTLLPPDAGAAAWLGAIAGRRARVSGGTERDFARAAVADGLDDVDLATWDVAFTDGSPSTMDAFANRFARNGFRRSSFFACYWLPEATALVAGRRGPAVTSFDADTIAPGRFAKPRAEGTPVLDRGRPADELELAIVDPLTATRCPDGTAGEIWLSGPNVAVGYLGRPDVSERTFCARLRGSTDNFLRTGDVGFVHDGGLHVADVLAA
ncbi:MAG TPA: AMP-binding protein [Actinophytocola sp.]|jgi:acyl-CoA synthetase (AMP-forming)/AMP-acid ligase II|uniref:AMP-binding protein n=1 Tax=Actinophytocola sp. TaxID=1872138 RepID=UPI002F94F33B